MLAAEPRVARNLSTFLMCKTLGCLPELGGLMDQPAEFVEFAAVFESVYAEHQGGGGR